ncbi:MAG: alpha/beta hydrolase [Desulfarculaceae bacterium]|nr:alpha/beta hydrolase [Desulfarculaceae bacterium]MCF8073506.1 alpha/beta hydrolase [Desulfarculaceae bacterium]MCF8100347.1 alpha/beta hydrolase [Desulfarculaceae bacterium]MCF8117538.1 alpha/beta hydrolase [Desulfarculaceae bacterium]
MNQGEEFNFAAGDLTLAGRLHRPSGTPRALVIISHGLESSMASSKLTRLAQVLAEAGLMAFRFDHSGCGVSPGELSRTSLTVRRDELLAAAAALRSLEPGPPQVYMGSSFGGTTALLAADLEPPLCSLHWSTPWDFEPLFNTIANPPERPPFRDLVRDVPRHDVEAVLARTGRACLVHGEQDEVVPVGQSIRALELLREPKELLVLPGADHRLSELADQEKAMQASLDWIERFLPEA